MPTIFTHKRPDLDCAASVWAAWRFAKNFESAPVTFVPADWDGKGQGRKQGDLLLDLRAGIKGKIDEAGRRHSCFATVMEMFAPPEEREAMSHLITFIDALDSSGNPYLCLAPELSREKARLFQLTGLGAVMSAIIVLAQRDRAGDLQVIKDMCFLMDGLRLRALDLVEARKESENPQVVRRHQTTRGEEVCLVQNHTHQATCSLLFEDPRVRFLVYVEGLNLGILRSDEAPHLLIKNPHVTRILETAGERDDWFFHENSFLACRGTRKAPAKTRSRVNPAELIQALLSYLEEQEQQNSPS